MESKTERLRRVETLFHEALEVEGEARAELIAAQCGGDSELAAQVQRLLNASAREEQQTAALISKREAGEGAESTGRRIGPYVLDGLLGRGGMGVVYRAHRADGEFEQKVAIKLIDLPLATTTFRERFRQERQILAGLEHPYIARLLDGGVTANGDPYLVMEFVDGVPIHRYCEKENLSLRLRLKLFLMVCEAVQFAHQNFVVHRDLKPDNILIAADGTPRLLDFGTAKLLTPTFAAEGGGITRDGCQSFTPQYASPEQVLGHQVTAASDTYSLGVLLYLLLTGSLPYKLAELTTAEMLRAVCNEPPRNPVPAEALGWRLDTDLDAILLKALRKEPEARYATAAELSADLRAWLEELPVAARRGNFRYKAGKFIRRNRISVAGSALLAASLIAGVIGVAWQANVANQERRRAEASAADLRQLSNSLLSELDDAIQQIPGTTGVQKLLVTRVLEHLDRTAKDVHGNRQTQLDLAMAYTQLAAIQDDPYVQNLGDSAGALASIDKAIALAAPLASTGVKDREAMRTLALAKQVRSTILWLAGKSHEAIPEMQNAVQGFDAVVADPQASPAAIIEAANAYSVLGDEFGQVGAASLNDLPDALSAYRKNLSLVSRALTIDPASMTTKRSLSIAYAKIGDIEIETDPAQALKDYESAIQRAYATPKAEHGTLGALHAYSALQGRKAIALVQLGEYSRAASLYEEIVQLDRRFVAEDPQDFRALADLEEDLNGEAADFEMAADPALTASPGDRRRNLVAAEKLLTQVVAIMEKAMALDPSNEAWKAIQADAQVRLATIRSALHERVDAAGQTEIGVGTFRGLVKRDQAPPRTLDQAANALLKAEPVTLRDPKLAVTCAERAVALSHRQAPSMLLTLAQAYRATGQIEKSRTTAKEGLALLPALKPGSTMPRIRKLLEIQTR
jgi:serine/threonine protein kinase